MESFLATLQAQVSLLLGFPLDSGKRIYLAYLAGSLVLILLLMVISGWYKGRNAALDIWRSAASPRIWLHRSALLDYQLLVVNPLMRTLLVGAVGFSLVPIALGASQVLEQLVGPISLNWSTAAITGTYTLVLFIADDFSRFLLHYLMHRVPWLWSIHRLHHSAEVLTPLTVYRIHPLESLLYSLRMIATQGIVLGVFFFGFGMNLSVWEIAGANLFTYLFNLAGANLRHSHVWLSWGPWLERIFISPAQHQIHHSSNPAHFDRNLGAFLALWDGLFGTLMIARGQTVDSYGLARNKASPHTGIVSAYSEPCLHLFRRMNVRKPGRYRLSFR